MRLKEYQYSQDRHLCSMPLTPLIALRLTVPGNNHWEHHRRIVDV